MSRELKLEELRENASELIAAIEKGESVTITREGNALATVKPEGLRIVHQGVPYPFRDLHITPLSKPLDIDPGAELIAERTFRDRELSGGSKELADEAVRLLIEERDYERSGKKYGL